MKSSSYYSRKAEACRELGRWQAADEWAEKAAKARRIEKALKAPSWYRVNAAVLSGEDAHTVFQTGTIYARAQSIGEARKLAVNHIEMTWPAADSRVDYLIDTKDAQRIPRDVEADERAFFNRPESVFDDDSRNLLS